MAPKIFKLHAGVKKCPILVIFQTGPGWPCTVSAALKNPSQDFKTLFALGADEFLAMLEGQIGEAPFFGGFDLVKEQCDTALLILGANFSTVDVKSDGYGLSDIFGFLQMSFWTLIGLSLGVPILVCFATNDFCIVYYLIETLVSKILKVKLVSCS